MAIEIGAGGTVAPGLVIGGIIHAYTSEEPSSSDAVQGGAPLRNDGRNFAFGQTSLSGLGVLADWYIDPSKGWHVQGSLGLSGLSMRASRSKYVDPVTGDEVPDVPAHEASGFNVTVGGGYEFWIADQWSLGPLLRVTYASLRGERRNDATDTDERWSHRAWAFPTLLLAATLH